MVAALTYRTSGSWGPGQGADLAAAQIDTNFFIIFSAVQALQDHQSGFADIVGAHIVGNQLYFTLSNDAVLGPLTVPTAQWNAKGQWLPNTAYAAFDVVTNNGSVYLVTQAIPNSGPTFSPTANDGFGHNLYMLLLEQPADQIPEGGLLGQYLARASGSPFKTEWKDLFVRLAVWIEGQPNAGEVVLQYGVVDAMSLPAGLAGSVIVQGVPPTVATTWTLNKGGNPIGTIQFNVSPVAIVPEVSSTIDLEPGDILTLVAPATQDATQANISFTLVAIVTG